MKTIVNVEHYEGLKALLTVMDNDYNYQQVIIPYSTLDRITILPTMPHFVGIRFYDPREGKRSYLLNKENIHLLRELIVGDMPITESQSVYLIDGNNHICIGCWTVLDRGSYPMIDGKSSLFEFIEEVERSRC